MNTRGTSVPRDITSVLRPICDVDVGPELDAPTEQEYGMRNPRKLLDPKLPSRQEVEEHCLTHLPYRNWCTFCVQGKGKASPHFKNPSRSDGLSEVHMDYCFLSTEGDKLATVLVAKERTTKMGMSTMVPMKGGSIEFPARRVISFLKRDWLGGRRCCLQVRPGEFDHCTPE